MIKQDAEILQKDMPDYDDLSAKQAPKKYKDLMRTQGSHVMRLVDRLSVR